MTLTVEGQVARVLIGLHPPIPALEFKQASPDADYLVTTARDEVRVTLEGFEGDRHAGMTREADSRTPFYPRGTPIRNSRQVSLVSLEELEQIAQNLGVPAIEPEWLGANLALRDVPDLSRLPPATRLFFPAEAVLVISEENHPCVFPGKAIQRRYPDVPGLVERFPKAAHHCRGLVAWVERPGVIRRGDTVRVAVPEQVIYSVPGG